MKRVERSVLLPFSAEAMFDLVSDVPRYHEFLPWCSASEVLDRSEDMVLARLSIAGAGLRQRFTTRNLLDRPTRITMHLVEGPFSILEGVWRFRPLAGDGCRTELDLQFDFDSRLLNLMLSRVFEQAADTLVDAFCDRAARIYDHG